MSNIGEIGEIELKSILSKMKANFSKPEQDKNGWDLLVEFPIRSPFLSNALSPKCFVQVKSTEVNATEWKITLKNALSLATQVNPAFIVLMIYGKNQNLKELKIMHFDHQKLKKIYKRIHKEYSRNGSIKLNSKKIQFDLKKEKRIIASDKLRCELKEYFSEIFLSNSHDYVIKKIKSVTELYNEYLKAFEYLDFYNEEIVLIGNTSNDNDVHIATVRGPENIKALLDYFLGYNNDIPDKVFNISENLIKNLGSVQKIIPKIQPKDYVLEYKHLGQGDWNRIGNSKLYSTMFFDVLPEELKMSRLKSEFIDIIFRSDSKEFKVNYTIPSDNFFFETSHFLDAFNFLDSLRSQVKGFRLKLTNGDGKKKSELDFKLRGGDLKKSYPEEIVEKVNYANNLYKHLGVSAKTSLSLISQSQFAIMLANIYLKKVDSNENTYFEVRVKGSEKLDNNKSIYVYHAGVFVVNENEHYYCSFVMGNTVEIENRKKEQFVVAKKIEIIDFRYTKKEALFIRENYLEWIETEVVYFEKKYEDGVLIVPEH